MAYRMTRRVRQHKAEIREAFLEGATRLFAAHGYSGTTVSMIVQQADSTKSTLYNYFRNKEDLFAVALERITRQLSVALNRKAVTARDPRTQMRLVVERFFLLLAENESQARILMIATSGLGGHLGGVRRGIVASHARILEAEIQNVRGEKERRTNRVLARCMVGAVYEALQDWLEERPDVRPAAEMTAREVAEFTLCGILSSGSWQFRSTEADPGAARPDPDAQAAGSTGGPGDAAHPAGRVDPEARRSECRPAKSRAS